MKSTRGRMRTVSNQDGHSLAMMLVMLFITLIAGACTSNGNDDNGNPPPPANRSPTASPGGNLSAHTGDIVTLSGAASSDPDGDTLSYEWSIMSGPAGGASLTDAAAATAHFQAGMPGSYVVQLIVRDPANASGSGSVTIDVTNPPPPAIVSVTIDHLPSGSPRPVRLGT